MTAPITLSERLRSVAHEAMAMALRCEPDQRRGMARLEDDGLIVTVMVSPCDMEAQLELSPCEKHVLAVLSSASRPWTGVVILGELEKRGFLHGESTLQHALAHLVRLGRLTVNKRAPRGYVLATMTMKEGTP